MQTITPPPMNQRVYCGSKVLNISSSSDPVLFGPTELYNIAAELGASTITDAPCVSVMNGDWNSANVHVLSSLYQNGSILVHLDRAHTGELRVNYIIGFTNIK